MSSVSVVRCALERLEVEELVLRDEETHEYRVNDKALRLFVKEYRKMADDIENDWFRSFFGVAD